MVDIEDIMQKSYRLYEGLRNPDLKDQALMISKNIHEIKIEMNATFYIVDDDIVIQKVLKNIILKNNLGDKEICSRLSPLRSSSAWAPPLWQTEKENHLLSFLKVWQKSCIK